MPEIPHPDDDSWIAPLLSAEADRHEFDTRRLVARVMAEADRCSPSPSDGRGHLAGQGRGVRSRRPGVRLRAGPSPVRSVRPWLAPAGLAAAGLATIATVGSLIPGLGASTPDAQPSLIQVTGGTGPASGTGPSPSAEIGTALPSPPTPTPEPPSATATTPPPSWTPGPSTSATVTPGTPQILTRQVKGGHVTLPVAGDRDWFVVAPGTTGAVLSPSDTRKITGPDWYSGAFGHAAPGPFMVTWSQSATAPVAGTSTSWAMVSGAGTGFRATAPAGDGAGVLILYVGVTGAGAHVAARLDGGGHGSSLDLPAGADGAGYELTIRFTPLRPGDTLLVDLSGDQGGGVAVVAGELR